MRIPAANRLSENRLSEGDSPIFLRVQRKIGTVPASSRIVFKPIFASIAWLLLALPALAAEPDQTVRSADQTLREIMEMNGSQIPQSLLAQAEGLVIVPDCIKVGFVAGIRRGHGIVVVKTPDGSWSAPQFVTLTGGSVGWQAGIQGTDVVLVFTTKKSIEGLLSGKFTVGADAAVAAGPIGRNAAAATDARLKAEILSYSRSRGLFVGVSLDGSAIEIDRAAQASYYVATVPGQPAPIPATAMQFLADLDAFTKGATMGAQPMQGAPMPAGSAPIATPGAPINVQGQAPTGLTSTRRSLAASAQQLYGVVDDNWRSYLSLPSEVFQGNAPPKQASIEKALKQYDNIAADAKYRQLSERGEFRATYSLLKEYNRELSAPANAAVPAPPAYRR